MFGIKNYNTLFSILKLSIRSNKQTCLLKVLMIHMLFVKHLCCKIFHKIMTQKAERYVTLWKSQGKSFAGCDTSYNMIYLTWLEYFASVFPGSYFYHSFLWHGLKFWPIQGKVVTFSSLSLPVIIKQIYKFLKYLNVQSFSLCWSRWDNFEPDTKICK